MITLLVCAALGAVVGGFALFGADTSALGLLRRAKRHDLGALPENTHGRVVGRVQALGEPLIAPLSGRRCVLYIVRVEDGEDRMRAGTWTPIVRDEKSVAFAHRRWDRPRDRRPRGRPARPRLRPPLELGHG